MAKNMMEILPKLDEEVRAFVKGILYQNGITEPLLADRTKLEGYFWVWYDQTKCTTKDQTCSGCNEVRKRIRKALSEVERVTRDEEELAEVYAGTDEGRS